MIRIEVVDIGKTFITPGIVLLFAVTGGLVVGNLYWAQPLLVEISKSLNAPLTLVGGLITATQVGYAVGIMLIVPLGDTLNRKRLIPFVMICSSLALIFCSLSSNYLELFIALCILGATTVSGQLITPLASELANSEQRGKVVGTIASGMLTGILLSRSISGFISDLFGWRAIYVIASILMFGLALVIFKVIPKDQNRANVPYIRLLASVFSSVKRYKVARVTLLIGFANFFVFSAFWTGLTFLLSAEPYSYSLSQIGLVGLVGLAGALVARRAGILHDKGQSYIGTCIGLSLTLVALMLGIMLSGSIAILLVTILVFDIGIQMVNVLNQTRLLALNPEIRSRLNTAFVSCNFIGGALGSALAGGVLNSSGWNYFMLMCIFAIMFALCIAVYYRKNLRISTGKFSITMNGVEI